MPEPRSSRAQVLLFALLLAAGVVVRAQADAKGPVDKGDEQGDKAAAAAAVPPSAAATGGGAKQAGAADVPAGERPEEDLTDLEGDIRAGAAAEEAPVEARTEAELDSAIQQAAAVQGQRKRKRKRVVSALIDQARPAELANGDGDVSLTGERGWLAGRLAAGLQ